jgi:hypothetical protein
MGLLTDQIQVYQNDLYIRANVLPQYVDSGIEAYDLLVNDQLFQNITSMFMQSVSTNMDIQYEVDMISNTYYDTFQLWWIILMMNGIMSIDALSPKALIYIPSPVYTQSYISESVSALKQTTPTTNVPNLSSILSLTGVAAETELSTVFIQNLISEALT